MSNKLDFSLSERRDASRNKLKWKWSDGDAMSAADLGSPTDSTEYTLCVYDSAAGQSGLSFELVVPPGGAWESRRDTGFSFGDSSGEADGVTDLHIDSGESGSGRVSLRARGAGIPEHTPPSLFQCFEKDPTVTVQLVNSEGACWTSDFEHARKNTRVRFKARVR